MDVLQLLWSEIGGFLLENCFKVVCLLVGPSVLAGSLHLSFVAYENILRSHVSHLYGTSMEEICSIDDRVDEVPQLRLLEVLALHFSSVVDLITQKVGIVFVLNLF